MFDDEDEIEVKKPSMDWLLTFADLISLLITFFVLLYSMKVVDTQRWDEMKGTFSGVFSVREAVIVKQPDKTTTVEKVDARVADNLDYIQSLLMKRFKENEVLRFASVVRDEELDRLTITLPSSILFDSGGVELKEGAQQAMLLLGEVMLYLDNRIEVGGHTDPYPVSNAEFPTNWELAMQRSIKVASNLEEQGVPGPVVAVSYAASRFDQLDKNLTAEERYEKARRVDVIIHGNAAMEKW